jgi:hypothetical protein
MQMVQMAQMAERILGKADTGIGPEPADRKISSVVNQDQYTAGEGQITHGTTRQQR